MIPVKLTVKNFLCYADGVPTLDLEGVRLACLCGPNGHGKSAVLDAITWALWGKARGKTQDELVHHGRDDMLVELEFLAQDNRFRATRRHSVGLSGRRRGASDLQLQVDAGTEFQPITGNSIRETQAKIDQIMGMDYDTFINSAFLLQGRADEFTNKTPGERKEVLSKILGLGYYDRLQDRARELADERRTAASGAEGELKQMRLEVSRRDGYQSEHDAVSANLVEMASLLDSSKAALDLLRERVGDLGRKRGEMEELTARIPAVQRDISNIQREMETRRDRIAAYQALAQDREAIESGLAQYQQLRVRYEELNRSREQFDHLAKLKSDLDRAVESARAVLEDQVKQTERRVEGDLRPRAEAEPAIGRSLEEARGRLEGLEREEQGIGDRRPYLHGLVAQIGQLEGSTQQLKNEGQELRSKLSLVQNSHQGASCPLCGSELGLVGCQRMSESYSAQMEEKLQLYGEQEAALKAVQDERVSLERELPGREDQLRRGREEAQSAIAVLERELEESRKTSEEMERVGLELAEAGDRLEKGSYAAREREQLADLEAQIEALGYDQRGHQGLYDEMQALQPFEERHQRLEEAVANLSMEQESQESAEEMCQRLQGELSDSMAKQQALEKDVSELQEWEDRLKEADTAHREVEGKHGGLFRRQVELEGSLKAVEVLEAQLEDMEGSLVSLREEQGIYQDLGEAFGTRGVQAMLIETVLPRVEEEANSLLGRMTDNRMHLKLESQREPRSRKGDPIETLEIKISDELGLRSYEMFSGGEAFRINLALRISLSKVLAHRRGAPLSTIFIDEGFGTQDAAGRERILDVIRAIEGDFEKIIVISHLDEIKEAFPVRIEVRKEEAGSTFSLS